jgi:hypothetical protein
MSRFRNRLTYANVIATIALFIALGGVSYAAFKLPKNSVGTRQLKKEAVTAAKVKAGSLPGSVLAAGTLPNLTGYATKAEIKGKFLGSTVVVNKTIAAPLAKEAFALGEVSCPAGYQAIAGGVDASNVLNGKVSSSSPLINGKEAETQPDGQSGPATGWFGAVTTQGAAAGSELVKIQVICAPLG